MRIIRSIGLLLVAASLLAACAAFAGRWVPALDAYASFMPLIAVPALLGLLLARTRVAAALAVLALIPVAAAVLPEWTRGIPAARAAQVRIVTHNVWHENPDPAETAQAILDAHPDVVLLQEANGPFRPMLAALRQHLPYATDCPQGCELAILSRWPIGDRDYFLKDGAGHSFGPPLLWARIQPPGAAAFTVATLHYPHPGPEQARRRAEMAQALSMVPHDDWIVAGDMNLTPWAAAMREQDAAFAPLTRFTRSLASWRRPLPVLPIDHLYAGPDWALADAARLPATGSDHYPLLIQVARR
ncbi:endonuclease/exonuclease/phosphatase family protein [uncultured Sphingomonas sp.]|uniref:endonuclease/exonuclease/phosphatase family protein n=1 Tax=uncultured Sphingomonas sp. TaxID=158754 RepID=UPI00263490EA|nr:endonuclease/exonuclease/phosphatase family protein [uncultured Sphingomonas sp.]